MKAIALTAEEIGELKGLNRSSVVRRSNAEAWIFESIKVNGGYQKKFPLDSLPNDIQLAHHHREIQRQRDIHAAMRADPLLPQPKEVPLEQLKAAWMGFEKTKKANKDRGIARVGIINAVKLLTPRIGKVAAIAQVAAQYQGAIKITTSSYYKWESRIQAVPSHFWAAYLIDAPKGPQGRVSECTPEAWDWIKCSYLSPSQPTASKVYQDAKRKLHWVLPSLRTVRRMLSEDIDCRTLVFWREGPDALADMYPPLVRSVADLHAYQLVNIDGHSLDVMCEWELKEGETEPFVSRPLLLGIQCVYSRKIMAWRMCRTENKHDVLLIFGDCFKSWGLPHHIYMDNGRAFASKWISGGGKQSFRGKVLASDPLGILPALDIQQTYVLPHHGQSKPIERAWRTFCAEGVSRSVECEGAYLGNSVANKPWNYGGKAIKEALLRQVIAREVISYNTQGNRRTEMAHAHGYSYDQVFDVSYVKAPIRRATAEQLYLCMLPVEKAHCDARSGRIELFGNFYWHEALNAYRGMDVVARFDAENLHDAINVYTREQVLICRADCTSAAGFDNVAMARSHAKARNDFKKAAKNLARSERHLDAMDIAALNATPVIAEKPKARVSKLVIPARDLTPKPMAGTPAQDAQIIDFMARNLERRRIEIEGI